MKRNSNWIVVCAGLCLLASPFAIAQQPTPNSGQPVPGQQTLDQVKDAAKQARDDAMKAMRDGQKKAADAMQGMDPKQMEEMQRSMTPNENHKLLQQFAGDWDVKTKFWMAPGVPPEESTATMSAKPEFEGRFVTGTFKGTYMGQPFEGRLVMGYNNNSKQNESIWFDSMSTGMGYSTGSASSDGKVFTFSGTMVDASGSKKTNREVTTFTSPNSYISEFFEMTPDGKENKMMEMTYTRNGSVAPAVKPAGTSIEPSK